MTTESARLDPRQSRQLLARAIAARQEYADYLWAVAAGQRAADPAARERLQARCEETFRAWNDNQSAWLLRGEAGRPRPAL
jgi:hypothetical protein